VLMASLNMVLASPTTLDLLAIFIFVAEGNLVDGLLRHTHPNPEQCGSWSWSFARTGSARAARNRRPPARETRKCPRAQRLQHHPHLRFASLRCQRRPVQEASSPLPLPLPLPRSEARIAAIFSSTNNNKDKARS
jgi:hypothetical protein